MKVSVNKWLRCPFALLFVCAPGNGGPVKEPAWSVAVPGGPAGHPVPYPSHENASPLLVTTASGNIFVLNAAGQAVAELAMDRPPSAPASAADVDGNGSAEIVGMDKWRSVCFFGRDGVYPTDTGPVPTRRWEAARDGAEDFEILTRVKEVASRSKPEAAQRARKLLDDAVKFATRNQEHASDIERQLHPFAPDFEQWMSYRDRSIAAWIELENAK